MQADVVVLGAGIVGVSIAVHLQRLGRQTILFDRRPAGEGTSFGNAGIIQREAVFPHHFPRDFRELLSYAFNSKTEARYHLSMLPRLLRPFAQYWHHSEPSRYRAIARDYARLIAHCVDDHRELAAEAGAESLLRDGGWTIACETPQSLAGFLKTAEDSRREFGVGFRALDGAALSAAEPHLRSGLAGGVQWTDPVAVLEPVALTRAYLALFEKLGGRFAYGDARTLTRAGAGWAVTGDETKISAREAVVALGAWSPIVTKPLGYDPPVFVKRGYHMHYRPDGNAVLNHPVLDAANGYMLVPMNQGIRLTTGAEFADRDGPPTPVQLAKVEPLAHKLMPALGQRIDSEIWMGARPCTPDMLPIIGPAPRQPGLWFGFGHGHQGLTLGPTTGRMLAAMMTGHEPVTDPTAYRPDRF
ncbi:FAD-binding oxidoreductase [Acidisoma cellulosilytica]|uniref:FAD-binding oxidoreductase n=2 Tax=Acidisoma cellulosilyticum TaxID=2802395 RepID=A0A963YWT2_9PROT|nr:FAD-binding oxidoreductase [Acidisoma cellulosilyticum]